MTGLVGRTLEITGSDRRPGVIRTQGQTGLRSGRSLAVLTEAGAKVLVAGDLGPTVSAVRGWVDLRKAGRASFPTLPLRA